MIVLVNPNDSHAVRNKDSTLAVYEQMIHQKMAKEAAAQFLSPDYIQHNPLVGDGPMALAEFFGGVTRKHPNARVVVHRIIAVGDYVFAHVNFLNLFNDDPQDTGVAGVDIFRFDADGKVVEHWDVLQTVGTPRNSAPWAGPDIPCANSNGMF